MSDAVFDPESHVFPARKSFDEFQVGETFTIPSRTVTEAHFAAFQALSGDNHPIHYDAEYCQRLGHQGMRAHGFQVLALPAAGAGPFPPLPRGILSVFFDHWCRF